MHLRLHLEVAFDDALGGALVSATEDALDGRSESAPKNITSRFTRVQKSTQ